ncbi:serine/threonine-protein kinase [Kitasatospora sp. NPDC056327]|uniref:serine/threonine-protein kinase n=1 Tax=Kitasatospora sp. NPDC056327 TaxID=3345785 RepID=UPI0035E06AC9
MAMMRLRREDPRIVGPYRLHRRLGAGGMGVVYLGSDRRGQRVALKLIRAELAEDIEFRTRFAREIAAASRIRGGCTARVMGSDIEADRPWLATAYVPGPSLYKRVGDEGALNWSEVARIGAALADGLVKVHEAGVVHRDLKPSNILLSPRGPRIIDFGIAWSRGASTLTHVGTAVGSPGFLAPEQVRGAAVTPATDVFAFGATLAYALTGDTPFGSGASSEVMLYRVVHEEPDLAAVPPQLAPLIRACLAKEPAERPGAAALHERLSELASRGSAGGAGAGAAGHGSGGPFGRARGAGARGDAARGEGVRGDAAGRGAPASGAVAGPGTGRAGAARGTEPRPAAGAERAGAPARPAGAPAAAQAPAARGVPAPGRAPDQGAVRAARAGAGGRPGPAGGGARRAPVQNDPQAVTAPLPRPEGVQATRPMRERQTPAAAREREPRPGRPRGRAGDRQHTPVPGGRPGTARQRLLRQRLVVFVTVTVGVALAIAAAQGCENRENRGLRAPVAPPTAPAVPPTVPQTPQTAPVPAAGGGSGLSADGLAPSGAPQQTTAASANTPLAAAAHGAPAGGDGVLVPAQSAGPVVDWPNRSYTDPAGGPAITLRDGRSAGAGPQVVLSSVLAARYKGAPASLVVLRRSEGSVPVDLVQLFAFNGDAPVALTSRSSAADPQAAATWRLENGALVREERVTQTGAATSTRYTLRADGTLEESWPGSATTTPLTTPPPAAAPAPPTAPTG